MSCSLEVRRSEFSRPRKLVKVFGVGLPAMGQGEKDGTAFAGVAGKGKLFGPLTDSDVVGLKRIPMDSTALLVAFGRQESGGPFEVGRIDRDFNSE